MSATAKGKRVFVMGDIHGNLKALDQCLERCQFNFESDLLIQLGDVSDRHQDTALVVDRLLKIKNLVAIRGNHDEWTNQWINHSIIETGWIQNGGQETINSYNREMNAIDLSNHKKFFAESQINFFIDDQNRIFVHGGFTHPKGPAYDLIKNHCLWDRSST